MPKLIIENGVDANRLSYSSSNLNFYWPLDDSTDDAKIGTAVNAETNLSYVAGYNGVGKGIEHTTSGTTYLRSAATSAGNIASGNNFSVSLYANFGSLSGLVPVIAKGNINDDASGLLFYLSSTQWGCQFKGYLQTATTDYTNTHGMSSGTWYHLCWTVDRTNTYVRFYRDGSLINFSNDLTNLTGAIDVSAKVEIGRVVRSSSTYRANATFDDIWFFHNKLLTATEVYQLYSNLR